MTYELTVIIPNYRRADLVLTCVRSLQPAIRRLDRAVQVVVVDDCSLDGSAELIRDELPDVDLVVRATNGGYPAAINSGLAVARADWVFTMNNDTTADDRLLVELMTAARDVRDVGSVAAQQRFSDDRERIYSAGLVLDRLGINADRRMGEPVAAGETEVMEVFGACGGAALYRASMITELGGFDELFRFGLEDADVAWRARMAGWRCLYAPAAVLYHDLGGTVPHGSPYRYFQAGRNRVLLLAKNADGTLLRRNLLGMFAYDFAYVSYVALRERSLMPLRGRMAGLRLWRQARRAGTRNRRPIHLPPAQGARAALRRRAAWNRA